VGIHLGPGRHDRAHRWRRTLRRDAEDPLTRRDTERGGMPARWTLPVTFALVQLAFAPLARAEDPSETEAASEPQAVDPIAEDPADADASAHVREVRVPTATASLTASGRWIDARILST